MFTWEHNTRDRQRLRLETLIKSLDALPADACTKAAGVLSAMVMLGHERIAIRVLEPAWDKELVDPGTATWLIGQVLAGSGVLGDRMDADHPDEAVMNEAAALLARRAGELTGTQRGVYAFPGHFMKVWTTKQDLPETAKDNLLLAMGEILVSRDKDWWNPGDGAPEWPTSVLLECARKDSEPAIQSRAAVLVQALFECFPEEFRDYVPPAELRPVLHLAAAAAEGRSAPGEYFVLADKIREWGNPARPSRTAA